MSAAVAPKQSNRMGLLRQALEKVLGQSVDSFEFQDMHACFPELAQTKGNLLTEYCVDLLKGIRENVVVRACGGRVCCARVRVCVFVRACVRSCGWVPESCSRTKSRQHAMCEVCPALMLVPAAPMVVTAVHPYSRSRACCGNNCRPAFGYFRLLL